ncbi:hypothetical protein [[Erwinia] mediterraneensis]|uniref:hypothetical protein n=1 Tax=[Erwinia] mediterraneensis TaxID=2161819 RepID=UPI00102F4794|nr:hypothetical protein [[Erwinia] mediterraneensis]
MTRKLLLLLSLLTFDSFAWSQQDVNFSFDGDRYAIKIIGNCIIVSDCENLTGHFFDKKHKRNFQSSHGETINTGYGRNLRGFIFTHGKLTYTLDQPAEEEGVDLERWILTITEINKKSDKKIIFQETGDIKFIQD